ncbi:MAG: pilus assembly protein TadE [Herminiimonas sp.]|nr:pilus assembly protein TadE [Herminiimonas sp.]
MRARQSGVALIELALILPMLLIMTFITTEFGRALYQYNTLTKSVRDAARYLSTQSPGTKIVEARNLVVYGNTLGTGTPLARGLTVANVPAPTWQTVGTDPVINTVTVSVTGYEFRFLFTSAYGDNFGSANTPGVLTYSPIAATMRSPI